jgi:hypothetical protein
MRKHSLHYLRKGYEVSNSVCTFADGSGWMGINYNIFLQLSPNIHCFILVDPYPHYLFHYFVNFYF